MYTPRRVADVLVPTAIAEDAAEAAAFRSGPRRAQRSTGDVVKQRVAPAAVAVAVTATASAFFINQQRGSDALEATPLATMDRVVESTSRDLNRPAIEQAPAVASKPSTTLSWSAAFGTLAGTKYAQKEQTVHAMADAKASGLGKLKAGDKVQVTDRVVNGFREIVFDGKVAYVADSVLGAKAPAPKVEKVAKTAKTAKAASTGSAAKYTGSTTYSGKTVLGLKPKAMVVYNAVTAKWSFKSIGGWRAHSRSNHHLGGAIDFMLTPGADSAKGWAVSRFLAANASTFGIDHIIFEQKIWTPYRPYWRPMANRGSITANHYDHVHVSVKL